MASLNKVMLIGNLTRDPETRVLAGGGSMTRFSLALNRTWKDKAGEKQEEVTFVNCVAFEKRAETLAQYCKKGHRLFVEGRLSVRAVTNEAGEKRTFTDINVSDFQFLTAKGDGSGKTAAHDEDAPNDYDDDGNPIPF